MNISNIHYFQWLWQDYPCEQILHHPHHAWTWIGMDLYAMYDKSQIELKYIAHCKNNNFSYLIFFLTYFFISNASCILSYWETPFRCARGFPRDSSTRLGCERYCTSYEACIGYTYQTKVTVKNEKHSCLLYTSISIFLGNA